MAAGKQMMPKLSYLGIRTQHFHNLTEQMQGHLLGPKPLFPGELLLRYYRYMASIQSWAIPPYSTTLASNGAQKKCPP